MLKVGLVLEIDVVAIPVNIKLYYFNKYTRNLIECMYVGISWSTGLVCTASNGAARAFWPATAVVLSTE